MNLSRNSFWIACLFIFLISPLEVSAATFKDVPADHFAAEAIGYLSDRGILKGYEDGTFKPDKKVNRAEALKIIASEFTPETQNVPLKSTAYSDVPDNAWYLPAIEWALPKGTIIDGPPKAARFFPTRTVTKVEFIKMLFAAHGVDRQAFGDIALPLSSDVTDPKAWYYSPLRYAVATTTTVVFPSGSFGPNRELTRGDVAVLLHRYTLFKAGQRTQVQLTETRKDVENVINFLSKNDIGNAEYASARAILIARGALLTEPEDPTVKVAVKIAEGYRALTRAYRAGLSGDVSAVIKHSDDAAYLADQAKKMSPTATALADQLKKYATSFKQQAR